VSAMKKAASIIHELGAAYVLIKGGHLPENSRKEVIDILFDGRTYQEYALPRIDLPGSHGTGCTYASALAAGLALGKDVATAAQEAKVVVTWAITNSVRLGAGHCSVDALAQRLKK